MTQLDSLLALVDEVLGDAVLGAYLHGSSGTGRMQPTSDTDVLVVTARPMTADQRRRLVAGILPLSGRRAIGGPARPVELTVVVRADVVPWRYPPVEDFLYGEWEREAYLAGTLPDRRENPDLAPLLAMTLGSDRPLVGPGPAALLEPIPTADLVRAVTAGVPGLLADLDADTRNVLLTLARILVTVESGRLVAKDEAAEHAIERLPEAHRAVLERARDAYRGPDSGQFDDLSSEVVACADALRAAIDAAMLLRNEPVV
ncbi:MAG TPA: aminoglycoside adenylyltransferase domain-containing protein [Candidatus Limnocylindrales bacterium]